MGSSRLATPLRRVGAAVLVATALGCTPVAPPASTTTTTTTSSSTTSTSTSSTTSTTRMSTSTSSTTTSTTSTTTTTVVGSGTGVVTTFAGQAGVYGSTDAGPPPTLARFGRIVGIAFGPGATMYVSDTSNQTVRRISATGVVTTLAGTPGLTGHADGTGAAASFNEPAGLAVDAQGNVYVADMENATIRKITPAGVVTTIAGAAVEFGDVDGVGSGARFRRPNGLVIDPAGHDLYVTDTYAETIRKVTLDTVEPVVSTVAGVPDTPGSVDGPAATARFDWPGGLAIDAAGDLFVADTLNHALRELSATGTVSTIAGGSGVAGATDGPAANARFRFPGGVAVDDAGVVYVADGGNDTIRRIAGGFVTTFAGSPGSLGTADGVGYAARFAAPAGLALDPSGDLYVGDTGNFDIRTVSRST
jgi:sugar lactone lactonase YvrE